MKTLSMPSPAHRRPAPAGARWSASLALALLLSGCSTLPPPLAERIAGGSYLPPSAGEYLLAQQPAPISAERFYTELGGAAGPFLDFNLHRIFRFSYRETQAGRRALQGTIIVLGSPLEAWGLASRLPPAARGETAAGASGAGEAFFTSDTVLVTIAAPQGESAASGDLARALARALADGEKLPREVSALGSLAPTAGEPFYEPTSLLGSTALAPALAAPLAGVPDGGRALVFLAVKDSPDTATRDFEQYLASRDTGRRGISFTLGIGESAGTAWDERYGWVNLARDGNTLAGVAGLPGPGDGWPLVSRVLASLRR
jgi:hypothetical protein